VSNKQTIEKMYAAFGRGDVAEILSGLATDVVWEYGVNSTNVPWFQLRTGREEVAKFFESLNALDIRKFQPKAILEGDNLVITTIDFEAVVKATGKSIVEEDEVHIFYFNDRGEIVKFRHRADTHLNWQALQN
jgi:uncharacterized protein